MQEAEATSRVLALPLPLFPAGVDTRVGKHKLLGMERPRTYSRITRAHLRGCLDSRVGCLATVPAIAAQTA